MFADTVLATGILAARKEMHVKFRCSVYCLLTVSSSEPWSGFCACTPYCSSFRTPCLACSIPVSHVSFAGAPRRGFRVLGPCRRGLCSALPSAKSSHQQSRCLHRRNMCRSWHRSSCAPCCACRRSCQSFRRQLGSLRDVPPGYPPRTVTRRRHQRRRWGSFRVRVHVVVEVPIRVFVVWHTLHDDERGLIAGT